MKSAPPHAAPIGIAGSGRMARALGRLLRDSGEPVAAVAGRDPDSTRRAADFLGDGVQAFDYAQLAQNCRRILIAVADGAIEEVADLLGDAGMEGITLHTCGARGPNVLRRLRERGVGCGVLHPLQTVPSAEQGINSLPGSTFAVGGDADAVRWAEGIVATLGGEVLYIAEKNMPLYHAAAVMVSNHVVGLIDAAAQLMKAAGVERKVALRALSPLLEAAVENAVSLGPEAALSGPVERGDVETVRIHLEALGGVPEPVAQLYRAGVSQVLDLARRKDLSGESARQFETILEGENTDA